MTNANAASNGPDNDSIEYPLVPAGRRDVAVPPYRPNWTYGRQETPRHGRTSQEPEVVDAEFTEVVEERPAATPAQPSSGNQASPAQIRAEIAHIAHIIEEKIPGRAGKDRENWEQATKVVNAFHTYGITDAQINQKAGEIWTREGCVDDQGASMFRHYQLALDELIAQAGGRNQAPPQQPGANAGGNNPPPPQAPAQPAAANNAGGNNQRASQRHRSNRLRNWGIGTAAALTAGALTVYFAVNNNQKPVTPETPAATPPAAVVVIEPAYPSAQQLMQNVRLARVFDFKHAHQTVIDSKTPDTGTEPRIVGDKNRDKVFMAPLAFLKSLTPEDRAAVFNAAASTEAGIGGVIPTGKNWYSGPEGRTDVAIPTILLLDSTRWNYINSVYEHFVRVAKPGQLLVLNNTSLDGERKGAETGLTDYYIFTDRSRTVDQMELVNHGPRVEAQ